ncbi:hypothetical protein PFISCL1PPCAC_19502 [Pristionchus fissidentatus]|uniref:Transmembrane protein n=1 Tax=Pristionchus fissidentatus TaxID=1538716 RepID=A0AAV5W914_9BILA|nr:hypothetical protein PFISCL1PPCAC_19502 [Pristionchus fissidentatus]
MTCLTLHLLLLLSLIAVSTGNHEDWSHDDCEDCSSSTTTSPTTTVTVPHHQEMFENDTIGRFWQHNHSLTMPFIIMCVITLAFLCFAQASVIMMRRRLAMVREIMVTLSESQLEELVDKNQVRNQKFFSIPTSPRRGPPSYSSIDLSEPPTYSPIDLTSDKMETSYASLV